MRDPRPFEDRLRRALLQLTDDGGRGVDAAALAHAIAAGERAAAPGRGAPAWVGWRWQPRLVLLLIGASLATLLVGTAVVGSPFGERTLRWLQSVIPAPVETPDPPGIGRNGLIAYCVGEMGDSRIHLMNADGTGDRELVEGAFPAFSADGTALSYRTGWPDDTQVLVARPDGSDARAFPDLGGDGGGQESALSPDGTTLAWFDRRRPTDAGGYRTGSIMGSRRPPLWLTPVDGGPARRLLTGGEIGDPYPTLLRWSPDGRSIAFAGMREIGNGSYRSAIYVVDVATGTVRRLTTRPGNDSPAIAWSPDSRQIAFTAFADDAASPTPAMLEEYVQDIFIIDADGANEHRLTSWPGDERSPTWSPDGDRIAYLVQDGPDIRAEVAIVRGPSTGSPATRGPAADDLTWSPDARSILYVREGSMFTVVADFRGPSSEIGRGRAFCPSWQRLEP